MNTDIIRAQWRNHTHGNAQFLHSTPRTCREAFGASLPHQRRDPDVLVLAVVMACFVIGLMVAL